MGKSVVADAGPLIAFGRIERLELLPQVLGASALTRIDPPLLIEVDPGTMRG